MNSRSFNQESPSSEPLSKHSGTKVVCDERSRENLLVPPSVLVSPSSGQRRSSPKDNGMSRSRSVEKSIERGSEKIPSERRERRPLPRRQKQDRSSMVGSHGQTFSSDRIYSGGLRDQQEDRCRLIRISPEESSASSMDEDGAQVPSDRTARVTRIADLQRMNVEGLHAFAKQIGF
ncbi:hypothetical protein, partial [Candidatus Similichlamydia epinepheli]|uniref:hypothetical protein n=1 Tax=Candidatus Similichlamydia epinepheli TaxID=1903953 RepID=UPI0013004918